MITGFNTDVRHGDVVFHVQTEDKGTGNPCIESLVYVGGQILARKRAGYRSLLDGAEALKAVAELMERQHRSMIQQIRAGEMDEKVAAIKGAAAARTAPAEAAPARPAPTQVAPPPEPEPTRPAPAPPPAARPAEKPAPAPAKEPPAPAPASPASAGATAATPLPPRPARPKPGARLPPVPPVRPKPVLPAVPPPRPAARRPPASAPEPRVPERPEPDSADRTLDQVILEYLEMESDQERLVMTMNRRAGSLEAGGEATLLFRTESSVDRDPIGQALITVRLISTIDEPQVLAEGRTNDDGELVLRVAIPELQTGSGAVIINAESSIGNAETRHLI